MTIGTKKNYIFYFSITLIKNLLTSFKDHF